MGKTNVQIGVEQQREVYSRLSLPPLAQLCRAFEISVRDFAAIFGISKSYAQMVMNERVMPPLDLAIRMSRYFECSVEDLFGWRMDDDGMRCPLLVYVQQNRTLVRLKSGVKSHRPLEILRMIADALRADYKEPDDIHNG